MMRADLDRHIPLMPARRIKPKANAKVTCGFRPDGPPAFPLGKTVDLGSGFRFTRELTISGQFPTE
ncbi:hypothetical protein GCM10009077_01260 [Roseibium denhamense]